MGDFQVYTRPPHLFIFSRLDTAFIYNSERVLNILPLFIYRFDTGARHDAGYRRFCGIGRCKARKQTSLPQYDARRALLMPR